MSCAARLAEGLKAFKSI